MNTWVIDMGTEYVTSWKYKVLFEWKLFPLHGAFMPSIKLFGFKIEIQSNNTLLVIDQNNFTIKTVNAYIICDLDNWPKIPPGNFTFACLVLTIIVKKQ